MEETEKRKPGRPVGSKNPATHTAGRPKGQPKTGGRKASGVVKKRKYFRLAEDVATLIESRPNQAAFIEAAVRHYVTSLADNMRREGHA